MGKSKVASNHLRFAVLTGIDIGSRASPLRNLEKRINGGRTIGGYCCRNLTRHGGTRVPLLTDKIFTPKGVDAQISTDTGKSNL